jgi:hypothetical protein
MAIARKEKEIFCTMRFWNNLRQIGSLSKD